MKNTFKLLGIIAFVAVITFAFFACDNSTPDPCESGHTFPARWTEVDPATATTDGSEELKCTVCGAHHPDSPRVIPASCFEGHTFTLWEFTTPATCIALVIQTQKCSVCGTLGTVTRSEPDGEFNKDNHAVGCDLTIYKITGTAGDFTATKGLCTTVGTPDQTMVLALAAILENVGSNNPVTIQFGNGIAGDEGEILDVGTAQVLFGSGWGHITLTGKITGNNIESAVANQGTIRINGPSATISGATTTIANTGNSAFGIAVFFNSAAPAELTISDAAVSATADGTAVRNHGGGTVTIHNGEFSTMTGRVVHNEAGGTVNILGGNFEVKTGTGMSRVISNENNGLVDISGGIFITSGGSVVRSQNAAGRVSISGGEFSGGDLFQAVTLTTGFFRVIGTSVVLNGTHATNQEVVNANRGSGASNNGILWHATAPD
jgi:hypothetical protein